MAIYGKVGPYVLEKNPYMQKPVGISKPDFHSSAKKKLHKKDFMPLPIIGGKSEKRSTSYTVESAS